jgi:hypothetical protein
MPSRFSANDDSAFPAEKGFSLPARYLSALI